VGQHCNPTHAINVVTVHGDIDQVISYNGDTLYGVPYPSAITTTEDWMTLNSCTPNSLAQAGAAIDLVPAVSGDETQIFQASGCQGNVEHWKVNGADH